ILNADSPASAPRLLWSRNQQDRYKDPGAPPYRDHAVRDQFNPFGRQSYHAVMQSGDWVFLAGQGASPQGDRPFLDRLNVKTLASERLFQCDDHSFESVLGLLSDDGMSIVTERESPADPPNYFVRSLAPGSRIRALTNIPDPTPQLRGISKRLVTYSR